MSLPLPLEPLRCRHPDCTLPEGGRCARASEFLDPLAECSELVRVPEEDAKPAPPLRSAVPTSEDAAPWKGRHLNLLEADQLLQRSPARVIAVLGPYDAGKTCLLASFFLQLASGQRGPFPYRFASSRTLYGFQDLIDRANRWSGKEGEEIVGHTPKEETEHPGQFLHLGVRPSNASDDRHLDLLLSDVPGEWFTEWTSRTDDEARRRLGFIQRSDGFVVVVDAAALLETSGAKMDANVGRLLRRLVSELQQRQKARALALVFSKFDRILDRVTPPDAQNVLQRDAWGLLGKRATRIWTALDQACEAGLDVAPFAVSAFPRPLAAGQPVGVMMPFAHVMATADRRDRWPRLPPSVSEEATGFAALRRWEATP
jgi:hypothetical protein